MPSLQCGCSTVPQLHLELGMGLGWSINSNSILAFNANLRPGWRWLRCQDTKRKMDWCSNGTSSPTPRDIATALSFLFIFYFFSFEGWRSCFSFFFLLQFFWGFKIQENMPKYFINPFFLHPKCVLFKKFSLFCIF